VTNSQKHIFSVSYQNPDYLKNLRKLWKEQIIKWFEQVINIVRIKGYMVCIAVQKVTLKGGLEE